jgi:hypothetical protein
MEMAVFCSKRPAIHDVAGEGCVAHRAVGAELDTYGTRRDRAALAVGNVAGKGGNRVKGDPSGNRSNCSGIGDAAGNHVVLEEPDTAVAGARKKRTAVADAYRKARDLLNENAIATCRNRAGVVDAARKGRNDVDENAVFL